MRACVCVCTQLLYECILVTLSSSAAIRHTCAIAASPSLSLPSTSLTSTPAACAALCPLPLPAGRCLLHRPVNWHPDEGCFGFGFGPLFTIFVFIFILHCVVVAAAASAAALLCHHMLQVSLSPASLGFGWIWHTSSSALENFSHLCANYISLVNVTKS